MPTAAAARRAGEAGAAQKQAHAQPVAAAGRAGPVPTTPFAATQQAQAAEAVARQQLAQRQAVMQVRLIGMTAGCHDCSLRYVPNAQQQLVSGL